jgi:hypothetical protein
MVKFRLFYLKPQRNRCGEVLIEITDKDFALYVSTFSEFRKDVATALGEIHTLACGGPRKVTGLTKTQM